MPQTVESPDTLTGTRVQTPRRVILFNDNVHTFDEVIVQVQKATGCSLEQAESITMEAHTRGQAVAFEGPLERCEHVAAVLGQIRLRTAIA
jgi:ATP-dependent Clp protease adapter protein ClpS